MPRASVQDAGGTPDRLRPPSGTPAEASPAPPAPASGGALPPALVAPLLFASGFCVLVYQVGWQRELRLVFGASTAATAAVVAVFMGGLGLGGFLLGPRVDRRPNPLAFYAALEGLVALTAAATPHLLDLVRSAYLGLGGTAVLGPVGGNLARLALAAVVLLPPTFLAGGTLGAAARAVEHEGDSRRLATGLLYGVNTFGALAGCLLTTFWALEALGTRRTLWLAAATNLLVAAGAFLLSRARATPEEPAPSVPRAVPAAAPPAFVLVAAALVGFAFFLMELVWYRLLGPILGGTVYTFGLVLAVALDGIAFGGLLYAWGLTSRVGLSAFAATCLAEAACLALPFALGDRLALLALRLRPAAEEAVGLWAFLPGWTAVTVVVVLPAAVAAGVQFPLLVALLGSGRRDVARHLGRATLANTAGAIAGALAGGFGLLPLLGAPACWRLSALLLAGLGLAAAFLHRPRAARVRLGAGLGAALVLAALAAEGPTAAWRHSSIGVGRAGTVPRGHNAGRAFVHDARRALVFEREGVESSVAVEAVAALSFVVNGKVDGNARNDAPTQVMGGLLGALLRSGPTRRSLVVGLGTGSTAGWLADLPGTERTDVVELEPAVREVARLCAPVNRDALANPRVHVVTGDAREVLMAGRGRYDLVFSEPSNPYRAGIASLFTREFYAAVRSRLEEDGLFLQWLQAYDVDEATVATVLATMATVFPEVEVWQVHHVDLVLVGSRRPLRHAADELRSRLRREPLASALRHAWRATELEDVLARFVAGPALARGLRAGGQPISTDDRSPLEFAFARTVLGQGESEVSRLRARARGLGADRPAVDGVVDWGRVVRQRLAISTLGGYPPAAGPEAEDPHEAARREAHRLYVSGELVKAAQAFLAQPLPAEGAVETALLAEGLAEAGDGAAVPWVRALHEVQPTEGEAVVARLALRQGDTVTARDALAASFVHYRDDPWPSQVSMSRALALAGSLAADRPDLAPVLFEALSRPFAVRALEEPRRQVRLTIGSRIGVEACRQALAEMEPWVPWREDVLALRERCYAATRDPRSRRAAEDLREFRRRR